MTAIRANGITIEYEEKGDKSDPAIIPDVLVPRFIDLISEHTRKLQTK